MRLILISTPIGYLGSGRGGGVELTLNSLVSGLIELGHSVKVVAPYKSSLLINGAELFTVKGRDQQSWQHQEYNSHIQIPRDSLLVAMVEKAILLSKNADLILNLSYDWLPIWMTMNIEIPIFHLISMANESGAINDVIADIYSRFPNNFAFHTKVQASDYSFIQKPQIVGNGFQLNKYVFQSNGGGPLAWVGRVTPEKGLEDAVYAANKLGEKLHVWGIIENKEYASHIEKKFSSEVIIWKGFLETSLLQKELGKCRALINTPKWNEAYGNVVVEALACGVPVISYKKGGPGEIIQHGETGFLVEAGDKDSLISYLMKINSIERRNCRKWVEQNASYLSFAKRVVNWLEMAIKEFS